MGIKCACVPPHQYNATLEDKVNLLLTVLCCLSRDIYTSILESSQANCCEHFPRKTHSLENGMLLKQPRVN